MWLDSKDCALADCRAASFLASEMRFFGQPAAIIFVLGLWGSHTLACKVSTTRRVSPSIPRNRDGQGGPPDGRKQRPKNLVDAASASC